MKRSEKERKILPVDLVEMKREGKRIAVLTCYDCPTARILDEAGVDALLVGDSLGMVALGYENTLPVTIEEMIHHARAVARGSRRALRIVDMPFLSYQVSVERALENAGRLVKEGFAEAVKLEGGEPVLETVRALVSAGIPVMGHLGLTPQHFLRFGGYRVQGKTEEAAEDLRRDARALQEAGVFSLVLECVPQALARDLASDLEIPVIGIGAGPGCDGQVLVLHDMVGMSGKFRPRFVKRYAELGAEMGKAAGRFVEEVRKGVFPGDEHSYGKPEGDS